MKRIACRMSVWSVPTIALALVFVFAGNQAGAAPIQPPLPDSGWLLDSGSGTTLYEAYGTRRGDLDGPSLPAWSTDTPFSYAHNHSLEFTPSGASLGKLRPARRD